MGGFSLHDADRSFLRVLTKSTLEELYAEGKIEWPAISEKEIHDRSKADIFSKGIVLFQTTWFIVHCVSRFATKLAVTELEVATLAFAMLNCITYWLWWHKPFDVRCAVPVYLKTLERSSSSASLAPKKEEGGTRSMSSFKRTFNDRRNDHGLVPAIAYTTVCAPVIAFCTYAGPLLGPNRCLPAALINDNSRVPTFYSVGIDSFHRYLPFFDLSDWTMFGVIGIFGAIHIILWSSAFPNATERWLWRESAMLITSTPLFIVVLNTSERAIAKSKNRTLSTLYRIFSVPFVVIFFMLVAVYVVSRFILLILPLILLHNLPPGALIELNWTEFFPHI